MITDVIINILMQPALLLFTALPEINISLPDNMFNALSGFVANTAYAFPIKALLPIPIASLSVSLFKISWAFLIRFKSFIPAMGD